ncbi:MAG TPA: hypothetical protein VLK34_09865 [Nocardioidaceae bacterium]|nr:hypothetical protein [Nocardioidaceae bacterium]
MSNRRGTSLSTPLSTKIVVFLGVALVLVGFGIAGWQSLAPDDAPAPSGVPTQAAQQYLPDIRTVVVYLAVIIAAILGGSYVLVRALRQRGRR